MSDHTKDFHADHSHLLEIFVTAHGVNPMTCPVDVQSVINGTTGCECVDGYSVNSNDVSDAAMDDTIRWYAPHYPGQRITVVIARKNGHDRAIVERSRYSDVA